MWRHALGLLGLLWRRRETGAALGSAAGHDTAKEVARPVANLWGLGLGRAMVLRVLAWAAAGLDFTFKLGYAVLVPADGVSNYVQGGMEA